MTVINMFLNLPLYLEIIVLTLLFGLVLFVIPKFIVSVWRAVVYYLRSRFINKAIENNDIVVVTFYNKREFESENMPHQICEKIFATEALNNKDFMNKIDSSKGVRVHANVRVLHYKNKDKLRKDKRLFNYFMQDDCDYHVYSLNEDIPKIAFVLSPKDVSSIFEFVTAQDLQGS